MTTADGMTVTYGVRPEFGLRAGPSTSQTVVTLPAGKHPASLTGLSEPERIRLRWRPVPGVAGYSLMRNPGTVHLNQGQLVDPGQGQVINHQWFGELVDAPVAPRMCYPQASPVCDYQYTIRAWYPGARGPVPAPGPGLTVTAWPEHPAAATRGLPAMPPCPRFAHAGAPPSPGPQLLDGTAALGALARAKMAEPARRTFRVGIAGSRGDLWLLQIEGVQLPASMAQIPLQNQTGWDKAIATVDGRNCAGAGQTLHAAGGSTARPSMSTSLIIDASSTTTSAERG